MKKKCLNCEWFVEETSVIGDYQHSEAVKLRHGFCLCKDLFTIQEPDDEACGDYRAEERRTES